MRLRLTGTLGVLPWIAVPAILAGLEAGAVASVVHTVSVDAAGCPGLDAKEVERLLDIEIAGMGGPPPARVVQVRLECTAGELRATVADPASGVVREQRAPAPRKSEPGRERLVALVVFQRFAADWPVLTAPLPPPPVPPPVAAPPPPARRTVLVGVAGEGRARALGRALATAGIAVEGAVRARERWVARFRVLAESGVAHRQSGDVRIQMVTAGGGAEWQPVQWGRTTVGVGVGLAAGYALLRGMPSSEQTEGSSAGSLVGDVDAAARAQWAFGRFWIGLRAGAGFMTRTAVGLVVGEADVTPGGPWVGAGVAAGVRFF